MKKTILILVAILTLTHANAQSKWQVDNAHSSITFSVSHFMISEVTGHFGKFSIDAVANEKFETPTFNVSIDTESINTNQKDRDDHLKSSDFFNVKKNPKITFTSSSYKQLEGESFQIIGKLTVNGITKDATFKGKLNGIIKDDESGKYKAGLKLTTSIERKAFNLGEGMSPIGKKVQVIINIEMNQE